MKPQDHHHHAIVVCDACKGKADAQNDTMRNQGANYAERRRRAFLLLVRRIPQAEVAAATGFTPRTVSQWGGMVAETLAAMKSNQEVY